MKKLPIICPSCGNTLSMRRLECPGCHTSVEGDFELPVLAQLPPEDQEFTLSLLRASGSLKELAGQYGISYPTVRNRLDALIERVEGIIRNQNTKGDGS